MSQGSVARLNKRNADLIQKPTWFLLSVNCVSGSRELRLLSHHLALFLMSSMKELAPASRFESEKKQSADH